MEGFGPMKLKRKEVDDVSDDFSDFSLSSPARKIRRLDADLPPIIENEEADIPIAFDQFVVEEQNPFGRSSGGIKIEELLPSVPDNEERAIVLFNPMNNTMLPRSLSDYSVSLDHNFITAFKNQVPWSNQSSHWKLNNKTTENNNYNGSLAVVPWVPPRASTQDFPEFSSETDDPGMMDAQETGEGKMEVEECTNGDYNIEQRNVNGTTLSEGFNQWQQQHCLIPQPPQNSTAPIVWYR